jgi:hypothetical protein
MLQPLLHIRDMAERPLLALGEKPRRAQAKSHTAPRK